MSAREAPATPSMPSAPAVRPLRLLSEVLLVGVLVCVASLPVVTILAAGGAGSVLLRELVEDDQTPTVRRFLSLMWTALHDPLASLAPVALLGVGTLDIVAVLGGLPGAAVLGPVLALGLVLLVICGLRSAARWKPGHAWRSVFADAGDALLRDWPGTLMLAAALLVIVVIARSVPAFAVVLPGFVVMAAVAVERRLPV